MEHLQFFVHLCIICCACGNKGGLVGIVPFGFGIPSAQSQSHHFWQHKILHLVEIADGFSPYLTLHTDNIGGFFELEFAFSGFCHVERFAIIVGALGAIHIVGLCKPRSIFVAIATPVQTLVVLMPAVSHIKIEIGYIRQHGRIAGICQSIRHVGAAAHGAPSIHHRKAGCHSGIVFIGVVQAHFLPTAGFYALLFQIISCSANVVFAHFVCIFQSFFFHQGLNVGRAVP